jgi:anaerobic magnesium-protoporphyrin IX monomethyl ester cyclase
MFAMESSRGCVHRCTFCYVQKSRAQRRWRAISAELLLDRVLRIQRDYRVAGVEFQDLEAFTRPSRILQFAEGVVRARARLFWNTCARIDDVLRLSEEELRLLRRSGLRRLALGVESGAPEMIERIRKGVTLEQVREAAARVKRTGIAPYYSFVAGFPGETEAELRMTTDLMGELLEKDPRAKVSILHCFRPLPGTEMFEQAVALGLAPPQRLEDWADYHMDKIDHPWLSPEMQRRIAGLNFLSLFLDRKFEEVDRPVVQLFARIYQPLARYRFARQNLHFFVEPHLKTLFVRAQRRLSALGR